MSRKNDGWMGCLGGLAGIGLVFFLWLCGIALSLSVLAAMVYVVILVLRGTGVIN